MPPSGPRPGTARLPELREYPAHLVRASASSDGVVRLFDALDALDDPSATAARRGALAAVLRGLRLGYHAHRRWRSARPTGPPPPR